jgi:hypothetical protein
MKGFTVERNLMFVSTVTNLALNPVNFTNMKEFTMWRNPMYVRNVGKHFPLILAFNIMKAFTGEINPKLSTVGKLSFNPVNFINIKVFPLLFTMYRSYVLRLFLTKVLFGIMKCSTFGEVLCT